ncbi:LytTR family transcriptional regulator [Oscillospiraceae bacterium CM]|nr:LytTR family transcriptional regulator [Oscillospiraceae bacterium CM]
MLIPIKNDDGLILINAKDIYYVTKDGPYVLYKLKKKTIKSRDNLYSVTFLLNNKDFLRCHKSFIINLGKIYSINKYNATTFNVKFVDINDEVFMTLSAYKSMLKFLNTGIN